MLPPTGRLTGRLTRQLTDRAGSSTVSQSAQNSIHTGTYPTTPQQCFKLASIATPVGMTLEIEPGRYSLARDSCCSTGPSVWAPATKPEHLPALQTPPTDAPELFALPALDSRFGMLRATAAVNVDHLVLNGNRQGRGGTHAHEMCSTLADNAYGFNGAFECSSCSMTRQRVDVRTLWHGLLGRRPGR